MINIFDLINAELDYNVEFKRLITLFYELDCMKKGKEYMSVGLSFAENLKDWPYRGTCIEIEDILERIGISDNGRTIKAKEDLLKLVQLILSARLFIERKGFEEIDNTLSKNIDYLLEKMNCKNIIEEDRVILIQKNQESILASNNCENDLGKYILQYLDVSIEKNCHRKKAILNEIAQELEPQRKKLDSINNKLTNIIFNLLNKLNIRHNNISGKNRIERIAKMNEDELIKWYDNTYELIVYLINYEKNINLQDKAQNLLNEITTNKE